MFRVLCVLLLLTAFLLCGLSPGYTDGDEWVTEKTSVVKIMKGDFVSPVLEPQLVSGDWMSLPSKDGKGIRVRFAKGNILVDKDQKGDPSFVAVSGDRANPFEVTLYYDNERVNHTFQFVKLGEAWGIIRKTCIEAKIAGEKIRFMDDNNNGLYGELGKDGIYYGGAGFGVPASSFVMAGGALHEVQLNTAGTEIRYRKLDVKTGKVDALAKWGGKAQLEAIIAKGSGTWGEASFDIAVRGGATLPMGSYGIIMGFYQDVIIDCRKSPLSFTVSPEGEIAEPDWGQDLKLRGSASVKGKPGTVVVKAVPTIAGNREELYIGDFQANGNLKFKVTPCTANGSPLGTATTWAIARVGSGGG